MNLIFYVYLLLTSIVYNLGRLYDNLIMVIMMGGISNQQKYVLRHTMGEFCIHAFLKINVNLISNL